MKDAPFFILGCVRSGTTFLRDVLRHHPNLACPEETHFFRWTEPFGTVISRRVLASNVVLKKHRQMDGVSEPEFARMLEEATSRADLMRRYMELYIARKKPGAKRWFDKTPQNVYGAAMLAAQFPGSRFIHIVRNPLDVVASLRVGKVISVEDIVGACNYWIESLEIIHMLKRAWPRRVHELHYEALTADLGANVAAILEFVGEDYDAGHYARIDTREKRYDHAEMFTPAELETVRRLCRRWASRYGYALQ